MPLHLLLAAALLAAAGCIAPEPELDAGEPPTGVHKLTILHTSDLHARLLPDDRGAGGFAQMTTAIAQEKNGVVWDDPLVSDVDRFPVQLFGDLMSTLAGVASPEFRILVRNDVSHRLVLLGKPL